jgi:hypothetical protein
MRGKKAQHAVLYSPHAHEKTTTTSGEISSHLLVRQSVTQSELQTALLWVHQLALPRASL